MASTVTSCLYSPGVTASVRQVQQLSVVHRHPNQQDHRVARGDVRCSPEPCRVRLL